MLAALAIAAYWPSLGGGFLWDDDEVLTQNPLVHSPHGLYGMWFTKETIDYWPATYTSFWLEWRLWGMRAVGYRIDNLLLHVAACLLVWRILSVLDIPGAFFATALFAVHPMNVESVAWIAERKNTLALVFLLIAVLCYLKHDSRRLPKLSVWYWFSIIAFLLAMLSKGSVATGALLLLLIVWWKNRRVTLGDCGMIVPFFAIAAALTVVNIWFQTHGTGVAIRSAEFAERLAGAGAIVWFYLSKALLPIDLLFVYPQWKISTLDWHWWAPAAAALVATATLWMSRRGWAGRATVTAWAFFVIALVPVLGLTDVYFMRYSLVADHYAQIALIGVVAFFAAVWSRWWGNPVLATKWIAICAAVALIAALLLQTRAQASLYRDYVVLFQDLLEKNPTCSMSYTNLGIELAHRGEPQAAVEKFKTLIRMNAADAEAHYNLANALVQMNRLPEAIDEFNTAIRLKPDHAEAQNNLGSTLIQMGRTDEALAHYRRAVEIDPKYFKALKNLSVTLLSRHEPQSAVAPLRRAAEIQPDNADAHFLLGWALRESGQPSEAIGEFKKTLELDPKLLKAYADLAIAYAQVDQPMEAVAAAREGIDLAVRAGQMELARQMGVWLQDYQSRQNKGLSPSQKPIAP